jgi:acyl-CoA dehydrogenase
MINNWDIVHNRFNIPAEMWQFLKENGFFGIIIPKNYGGKQFSALAHSEIIAKISARSITVATIVAVPNSLGPAELLLEYGTDEQKNYYLPRLASGEEIPCFGLTGPEAGSDASAMPDYGIVCKGQFNGQEVTGIRLNWNKRYITLAPVATLLGLAFKLYDPDHLIGEQVNLGITCALVPVNLPGITIGRRHYPANSAFPNGPTQGKDVFIPIDWIIGGAKNAGHGWHMLIERLSIGRGISLPSIVGGNAKLALFTTGAYSRIRKQFNLPIGRFEGVEEFIARIAGNVYITEAIRTFVVAAIDRGEQPAVPSAISKCHATEISRKVVNDAMDVHGGKGICMGPRNYIAQGYMECPIGITVEGANILTRNMIIFGQGAIRCHPYVLAELMAANNPDDKQALKKFDQAIFSHAGLFLSNLVRTKWLGFTSARFISAPTQGVTKRFYQKLSRYSAAFALCADVAMMVLGGDLKRRERLSARLGDLLSYLYLISAVLKRYEDQGRPEEDLPLVKWACLTLLFEIERTFASFLQNFPVRWMANLLSVAIFPWGKRQLNSHDKLAHQVASLFMNPTESRQRLCSGLYLKPDPQNPAGLMEVALQQIIASEEYEKRMHKAEQDKLISGYTFDEKLKSAIAAGILSETEAKIVKQAHDARIEIITVDDFAKKDLENGFTKTNSVHNLEKMVDSE